MAKEVVDKLIEKIAVVFLFLWRVRVRFIEIIFFLIDLFGNRVNRMVSTSNKNYYFKSTSFLRNYSVNTGFPNLAWEE